MGYVWRVLLVVVGVLLVWGIIWFALFLKGAARPL